MAKKTYPVVCGSQLGATTENTTLRILQADEELSKLNRRLYRMGRFYELKIDMEPGNVGTYEVYALRNDWGVQKAYQLAYEHYRKNTADERNSLGSQNIARWEDFRVEVGASGNSLFATLRTPAAAEVILTAGEFALANVVDSSNVKRTFTWGTPSASQYGILQEYDKTGNAQGSPSSFTADGAYEELDTEINAATYDDLQLDNNLPPYDQGGVNSGSPFVKVGHLGSGAAGDQRLSTGYFTAPCGIVLIVGPGTDWNSGNMHFTVKKGNYKGVHAPSMLE